MPVSGDTSLPIAPRNKTWNGSDARRRVVDFYTKGDSTNWSQVKRAFMWIDPGKEDMLTGYNLGFADIVDGKLQIIDNGVFAVAGGHGVSRIQAPSAAEKNQIKRKVNTIYRRMKAKWPDDRFAFDPPFPDVKTLDVTEEDTPEEVKGIINEVEQKFYPYMNSATSFAELESLEAVRRAIGQVFKTVHQFESLAYSIARQSGTPSDLVTGLKTLTREMTSIFDNMDFEEETKANDEALTSFINDQTNLDFDEVKQYKSAALLKAVNGQRYFYGRYTNNLWDKDDEVLLNKAHEEFVLYLDEHPDKMPELWDWHERETAKTHRAVWADYSDGFLHMIWPITEDEAKGIEDFAKEFEPGMSHGFEVLEREGPEIEKYRTFEASILPLENAANEWTTFEVISEKEEQEKMFTPEKQRALRLLSLGKYIAPLGKASEADAAAIDEAGAERANKGTDSADTKGTETMDDHDKNEKNQDYEETPGTAPETPEANANAKGVSSEELLALQASIVEGLQLMTDQVKSIGERMTVVEEALKGIKEAKGQSPSVAAWVAAQKAQTSVGDPLKEAVDQNDTGEVTKEDPLFGKGPEEYPIATVDGHMLTGL